MFVGSFVFGNIPLAFSFSEEKLQLVSTFGAGILVGTALIVILPEGVDTIYSSVMKNNPTPDQHGHKHKRYIWDDFWGEDVDNGNEDFERIWEHSVDPVDTSTVVSSTIVIPEALPTVVPLPATTPEEGEDDTDVDNNEEPSNTEESSITEESNTKNNLESYWWWKRDRSNNFLPLDVKAESDKQVSSSAESHEDDEQTHGDGGSGYHNAEPHKVIGLALATGFAFMLIVEQIGHGHSHGSSSGSTSSPMSTNAPTNHVSLSEIRLNSSASMTSSPQLLPSTPSSPVPSLPHHHHYQHHNARNGKRKNLSATIGLIVHAAADGVALGAASSSGRSSLEFIVFLAIMLHKAPSSFGLTTFLLMEGLQRRMIRQFLLVFSLAAPISALITYGMIMQYEVDDPSKMKWWTGVLLLFSAGTFLYVAIVDILPGVYESAGSGGMIDSGDRDGSILGKPKTELPHLHHQHHHHHHDGEKKLSRVQIVVLLVGIFFPMLLLVDHGH